MEIILRDYQKATVERMLQIYEQDAKGKGKFVWATGLGKTVGFSAIAHEIRKRTGTNVLIIAHREELLTQAAQKYRFIDPDAQIGKVGSGYYEWGLPITVASIQTLARPNHLKNLKHFNYGLVIVDECHHAHQGNEYGKVLNELPNAFKIGCTATDDRMDKITNDDLFGESILTMSILSAIEQGYLADIRAIAIKTNTNLEGLHTREGDYLLEELKEKIDTPERNQKIVEGYLEHGENRQAMAFTIDIAHATHLAEAFTLAGVQAVAVSGKTPNRSQILKDFESGKYKVLCNCQVFTEGYDAETIYDEDEGRYIFLSCAIMARPTKSRGLFTQCIGRILRLAPTKKDALILDATDNVFNHRLEPQTLAKVVEVDLQDGESVAEAKERKEQLARAKRERKTEVKRAEDIAISVTARLDWKEKGDMFILEVGSQKHRIALVPTKETEEYTEPFNGNNWCPGCYEEKITDKIQLENRSQLTAIYRCSKCDYWQFAAGGATNFSHTRTTKAQFTGYYSVWARLAPDFKAQQWMGPAPLDWNQQYAERRARQLLADPTSVRLLDRNRPWRSQPATEKQLAQLAKLQKQYHLNYDPETITNGQASDLLSPIFDKWDKAKEAKGQVAV